MSEVFIFNALWFKPDGGAEMYREYMERAEPLVRAIGGEFQQTYRTEAASQGDFDPDLIFFGRYPSEDALMEMLRSPEYQAIGHLRSEAIEKAIATRCSAFAFREATGAG